MKAFSAVHEITDPKKHSVRTTEGEITSSPPYEGPMPTKLLGPVYLTREAYDALGKPEKIRITVEALG